MESKCEVYSNSKRWRNHKNQLHREDGPAVEFFNGTKHWFLNNKLYREDGPAIITAKGQENWCLNDIFYNIEDMSLNLFLSYCKWEYKKEKKINES